ncbi:hypothetical protein H0H92_014045 [Tricholoma furcatifolium]|nr:hypothetical protein H0H92_014045 [Tricholoma furcatifolium]
MATQQAYNAYTQNKGTLVPGQSIVVNKYTVQVERYLSQGGFAHVYLVRTATPVYNTTHHVLKRIAVANEAMLKEVKKEVDVMRLLKGHPNIVHLIDAAWQQTPNGMYEVFILMEFCPGGGIIDMMNRRLRERLTEAEILQIFVDVCEGVAYMHNLRPALLHRDLKVENILQSTSTSYKLCDFGSATTVSRPPATTQEIRALEADLNRHTTLQYRAPEMVDVYSRRPVDEKSDVWALGVLLYKLCYYTTPFEEHGQLAILNVQYKIPPYPVYSNQMNQLIASMLQEHGVRRPSVFEILTHVHRLRGTKSRFKYTIPTNQPLSPRHPTASQSSPSPTVRSDLMAVPQPNRVTMSVSPSRGQGVEARDKVMAAIAPLRKASSTELRAPTVSADLHETSDSPMRRGRPLTREPEPLSTKLGNVKTSENSYGNSLLDGGVPTRQERQDTNVSRGEGALADAWNVGGKVPRISSSKDTNIGFSDNFSSKLWDGVNDKTSTQGRPSLPSSKPSSPLPTRLQPPLAVNRRPSPDKDAFEGLGLALAPEKPAPTLAEARKLRTGLAIMHSNGFRTNPERLGGSASRLSPSPRQPIAPQFQLYPSPVTAFTPDILKAPSPKPPQSSTIQASPSHQDGTSAETRFPSLEELDSGFQLSLPPASHTRTPSVQSREDSVSLTRRNGVSIRSGTGNAAPLKPESRPRVYHAREGTRSEQVTGVAMRDSEAVGSTKRSDARPFAASSLGENKAANLQPSQSGSDLSSRPGLSPKYGSFTPAEVNLPAASGLSRKSNPISRVEDTAQRSPMPKKPKDWLTGEDDTDIDDSSTTSLLAPPSVGETVVVRDSPSKRASLIESSPILVHAAVVAQHDHTEPVSPLIPDISPTLSKFTRSFPPIDGLEAPLKESISKQSPVLEPTHLSPGDDSASSGDEGPEDAVGVAPPTRVGPSGRKGHKGRQSSVHDLVDLYGGGVSHKEKEREARGARPSNLELDSASSGRKGHVSLASVPSVLKPAKPLSSSVTVASKTLLAPVSTSTFNASVRPLDTEQTTPTSVPTPSPSRSRPQSMIMFPSSKSQDSYSLSNGQAPVSPGLVLPDGAGQRNVRRTSISDIVQRYEGIGATSKPTRRSVPLSPTTPRPAAAIKLPGLASTDARSPKRPDKERAATGLSAPVGDYVPSRRPKSPTESKVSSPAPISRPIPIRHHTLNKDLDGIPRNTPPKPEVSRVSKFPTPSTADDSLSRTESGTSSSPERPYQGVGKLIDQWQKKSAEAETSKTMVRGRSTFTAK